MDKALENYISSFRTIIEKLRYSRYIYYYATAVLLGISIAVFAHSFLYYLFAASIKNDNIKVSHQNGSSEMRAKANIQAENLIGGVLFSEGVETTSAENPLGDEKIEFTLVGTVEGHWSFARAVIKIKGSKDSSKEIRIGEYIGNKKLIYIGRNYIYYLENGSRVKMEVGQDSAQAEKNATSSDSGGVIKKVISREEVNKWLSGNASGIYKNAAWGPKLKNGKVIGVEIRKLSPSHVFYKLGARKGDMIKKVNGYPLSNTERMFEIWKSLKTASGAKIELERNGKNYLYDFTIQN